MKKFMVFFILAFAHCTGGGAGPDINAVQTNLPEQYRGYIITQSELEDFCNAKPELCRKNDAGDTEIQGYTQYFIKEMFWIKESVSYNPYSKQVFENGVLIGTLDWSQSGARFEPVLSGGGQ